MSHPCSYLSMDMLVRGNPNPMNKSEFDLFSNSGPSNGNLVEASLLNARLSEDSSFPNGSSNPTDDSSAAENAHVESDHFDGVLKYINQMLMEEELEVRPCMLQESLALQAAEKYFHEALYNDSASQTTSRLSTFIVSQAEYSSFPGKIAVDANQIFHSAVQPNGDSISLYNFEDKLVDSSMSSFRVQNSSTMSKSLFDWQHRNRERKITQFTHSSRFTRNYRLEPEKWAYGEKETKEEYLCSIGIAGKRSYCLEDGDQGEGRSNKQFASFVEEFEHLELYDKALLCSARNPGSYDASSWSCSDECLENNRKQNHKSNQSRRGRPRKGQKLISTKKVVDLWSLLIRCAQAVGNYESSTAYELLRRIRQHCSPNGDAMQRLSYYFANALEARLAGTGTSLYTAFTRKRTSVADILKAYQLFWTACPFKRMSNIFANKSIGKLTKEAKAIHIIDFGILYGFQWPCFIQGLSLRSGGPPKLRITGIDLPQPGLRPAERVEETGRRLAKYCKRFNVPFQYNAIAERWDTIKLEDIKIDRDEMLVVNCLYRLRNLPDETVTDNNPRDAVLKLIREINPNVFIHGIVNGAYNSSFFVPRFREALFHFSSLFEVLETTLKREDQERLLFEKEVLGRDVMNVVACEGIARVDRPETYKQWQLRSQRAGFTQLPLNEEIMNEIRTKVRLQYHKDFLVNEDSSWMLQGWRGRIIHALSCWKTASK